METLSITEIFFSIQGETKTVGIPTIFIRLTGCPLRCHYCDTSYAFHNGTDMTLNEIIKKIENYNCKHVTVTGGEPLDQPNCLKFLTLLCNNDYNVSLETGGMLDISLVDKRIIKILDIKTPGSGEDKSNNFDNIRYISNKDQIKFIICDKNDYTWMKEIIAKYDLFNRCEVLLSPSFRQLSAKKLANWILKDNLPVRFQLQIHKYIWDDAPGY